MIAGCTSASPHGPPLDREGSAAAASRPEGESRAPDTSEPGKSAKARAIAVPVTAAEARALWTREGKRLLPLLATFFQTMDLTGGELQGAFELLREISIAVPPEDPQAPQVLASTCGFLRLPKSSVVELPGAARIARWTVILRLVVGLRSSGELGPMLARMVRDRAGRPGLESERPGRLDPDSNVIRNSVYSIAYLAYLPGSDLVMQYARESRGLDDRMLALEMLASLGDPRAAPIVREMIETSHRLRVIKPAARTLQLLIGAAAESTLVEVLRRKVPALERAVLGPLFSICTPSALKRIIALKDSTADERTRHAIELHLKAYEKALGLPLAALEELIRSSPDDAARRMLPHAQRLHVLEEGDRRLTRDDLTAVLRHWRTTGTLYTPEWSWVRDRHIVAVATLEHVLELEAVRRAVLREYRATSLNEASIVQRMIVAIRARARETGKS